MDRDFLAESWHDKRRREQYNSLIVTFPSIIVFVVWAGTRYILVANTYVE